MTEPKVSERMRDLVRASIAASTEFGKMLGANLWAERERLAADEADDDLLTAIAEIEQRAEKWENLARAAVKATVFYPDVNDKARIMIEMEQAIDALGNEWDEAVKGEG